MGLHGELINEGSLSAIHNMASISSPNIVMNIAKKALKAFSPKYKKLQDSQNADLTTSHRLLMCQVVFTKICH